LLLPHVLAIAVTDQRARRAFLRDPECVRSALDRWIVAATSVRSAVVDRPLIDPCEVVAAIAETPAGAEQRRRTAAMQHQYADFAGYLVADQYRQLGFAVAIAHTSL